jgi:hypothetical protein
MVICAAGDWGPDPSATATTACLQKPDVMLGLGDYSYESGADDKAWFSKMGCLQDRFVGALGNHDVGDADIYSALFGHPSTSNWNFSIDFQDVHVLAINTESPDIPFISNDLKVQSKWKIVIFHKPVYTSPGAHGPDEAGIRDTVVPLFDANHVNLVLQGHNHNYQRSYPLNYGSGDDKPKVVKSGTTYIVAGTGGESHYDFNGQAYYIAKQFSDTFGVVSLSVTPTSIIGNFVANDLSIRDNLPRLL